MLSNKTAKLMLILGCFFMGLAQAEKPLSTDGSSGGSFWSGWFSRMESKKLDRENKAVSKPVDIAQAKGLFSRTERENIRHFYKRNDVSDGPKKGKKDKHNKKHKTLPHGLQKKLARGGQLPPGWQNKVVRGEVLGNDILRQSEYLPSALTRRLPELEDGVEIRRVGDKVVRVLEGSGTVIDVIDLADILLR